MMRFLFLLCLLLIAAPAGAQEITGAGSHTYGHDTEAAAMARQEEARLKKLEGRIKPQQLWVTLVPGETDEVMGLQMRVPDVVQGCWEFSPLDFEVTTQDPHYYDIIIKDYARNPGPCTGGNKNVSITIPLDKSEFEAGKIKQLRMTNEMANDRYDVTYNNGRVEMFPKSQNVFKTSSALLYQFPVKTVDGGPAPSPEQASLIALILPTAPMGADTTQALHDFAIMRGLIPADAGELSSLPALDSGTQIFYAKDVQNVFSTRVDSQSYQQIGQTGLATLYEGVNGREESFIPAAVYAKRIY